MVVGFDVDEFRAMYPEYKNVTDAALRTYFKAACLLLNNTNDSPVKDGDERKFLLYLLVCHIATLKQMGNGTVGILTSAAQGSVNASVTPLQNMNWYKLTQCGNIYWNATAKYRLGVRWFCGC